MSRLQDLTLAEQKLLRALVDDRRRVLMERIAAERQTAPSSDWEEVVNLDIIRTKLT